MRGIGITIVVGTLLAMAAGPASAPASVARVGGGGAIPRVTLRDTAGEANQLGVSIEGRADAFVFRDGAAGIKPGRRCERLGGHGSRVRCPLDRDPIAIDVAIHTGEGDDRVRASYDDLYGSTLLFIPVIATGPGADQVDAGPASDYIRPGDDDDDVAGGPGDDSLIARGEPDGTDAFDGGPGSDYIDYHAREAPVTVTLDDIANDGAAGENDELVNVEGASGGRAADVLIGADGNDGFEGRRGVDTIETGAGRDVAFGGDDGDQVGLGPGRDIVLEAGDAAIDTIDCGDGRDTAYVDADDITVNCEKVRVGSPFKLPARLRRLR